MSLPLSAPARFVPLSDAWKRRFHPASVGLFEWTDYFFHFPDAHALRVDDALLAPLAPGVFRVRWENALGLAQLQPERDGAPQDQPLWAEVLSPKFPTPDTHFALLNRLLGDLWTWSRHLVWTDAGLRRGAEKSSQPPSEREALDWTVRHGESWGQFVARLLAQPPHLVRLETCEVTPARVSRLDANVLHALASEAHRWRPTSRAVSPLRALPERVPQTRRTEVFDGPVLREAVAFAREVEMALEKAQTSAWWNAIPPPEQEIVTRTQRASEALLRRFGHLAPCSSRLDARDPLARELARLKESWHGAGAPVWDEVETWARTRDIALLWEFWTFPHLAHLIGSALRETARFEATFDAPRGMLRPSRAVFESGTLVWNVAPSSYSTPLRPDFLWLNAREKPTVAFDAKFRLQIENSSGVGADLHKMHAYRDALGVGAALALHPGERSQFFDRERGPLSRVPLRAILESAATGVGSWGLVPNLDEQNR